MKRTNKNIYCGYGDIIVVNKKKNEFVVDKLEYQSKNDANKGKRDRIRRIQIPVSRDEYEILIKHPSTMKEFLEYKKAECEDIINESKHSKSSIRHYKIPWLRSTQVFCERILKMSHKKKFEEAIVCAFRTGELLMRAKTYEGLQDKYLGREKVYDSEWRIKRHKELKDEGNKPMKIYEIIAKEENPSLGLNFLEREKAKRNMKKWFCKLRKSL